VQIARANALTLRRKSGAYSASLSSARPRTGCFVRSGGTFPSENTEYNSIAEYFFNGDVKYLPLIWAICRSKNPASRSPAANVRAARESFDRTAAVTSSRKIDLENIADSLARGVTDLVRRFMMGRMEKKKKRKKKKKKERKKEKTEKIGVPIGRDRTLVAARSRAVRLLNNAERRRARNVERERNERAGCTKGEKEQLRSKNALKRV